RAVEWIASGDIDGCCADGTLDSLHLPGNATHGFMDFMLMMGVAGEGVKADHVESLDLFHTMEADFTLYPERSGLGRLSQPAPAGGRCISVRRHLRGKSAEAVGRGHAPVDLSRSARAGFVEWWEGEVANTLLNCHSGERTTWLAFSDAERDALVRQDHVALFE